MKKYIPVFGPQELFDGAPDDAEMAYETANHVRVYYKKCNSLKFFSNSKWVRVLNEKAMIIHAMRRIIKEPKCWTWEDKKAGKLPEIGCRIYVPMMLEEQNVIYSSEKIIVSISDNEGAVTRTEVGSIDRIKPIESPEEKAARLRDEWVEKAAKQLKNLEYTSTLTSIYDALLSGELPMPNKE